MRLRNVKNAGDVINNHPLVITELTKDTFSNDNKVSIEIGTGKGDFITKLALANPNINYVGIEKYESVLYRALEKVDHSVSNLRFICDDATNINDFIKVEITNLYLNFSDPWPKKRHEKRRLTYKSYLDKYEKLFNNEVNIYLKTDNKAFFSYSLMSFSMNGYLLKDVSLDLHQSDRPNIITEYENKFSNLGYTINYLHATKKM